ncbi:MAG: META domain-containing protein [Roseinatronobacter sp.]|nr:META domain-containing protein [Roseinatronobacter sp.]
METQMRRVFAALALALAPQIAGAQADSLRLVWDRGAANRAEAVVVLRDIEGTALITLRAPVASGAQADSVALPPLPRAATTVQAGLIEAGRVVLQSPLRPLSDRSAAGFELGLRASLAIGFHDLWACDDGQEVQVTHQSEGIYLRHPTAEDSLKRQDTGGYLSQAGLAFSIEGNLATLALPDHAPITCLPALFRPLLPLTAPAKDGSWRATISPEQALIDLPGLADEALATSGLIITARRDGEIGLRGGPLHIAFAQNRCRLDGQDMLYPLGARLVFQGMARAEGCAGVPLSLIEGKSWRVNSVFGVALTVVEGKSPEITLQIAEGQISGRGTCNRYLGTARTDNGRLEFADLGTTRIACPQSLQNLELRFLDALEVTTGFDISRAGMLILRAGAIPVLTAHRRSQ